MLRQVLCLITPDGERTFCFHAGASEKLDPSEMREALRPLALRASDFVYFDAYNLLCTGVVVSALAAHSHTHESMSRACA